MQLLLGGVVLISTGAGSLLGWTTVTSLTEVATVLLLVSLSVSSRSTSKSDPDECVELPNSSK
jgi:hypothetical protein